MKKVSVYFIIAVALISTFFAVCSCGGGNRGTEKNPQEENSPNQDADLNISIFLDLSNRLVRDMTPNQTYRDTAIISYVCDYFRKATLGPQILNSTNKIKVFFYPTPATPGIANVARELNVDIAALSGMDKRKAVDNLKSNFLKNLNLIYSETIKVQQWVGCDIWDFFSSKKVDSQCIRKGARNILLILTDGYIYHANNRITEGANAHSFILPQTLANPSSSLIARRTDVPLNNLEVLMLEVNPYQPQHRDQMKKIIGDWFTAMGIKKYAIAETDANMTNTETIIKNFLEEK